MGHGDGKRDTVAEKATGLAGQPQNFLRREDAAFSVESVIISDFDHASTGLPKL